MNLTNPMNPSNPINPIDPINLFELFHLINIVVPKVVRKTSDENVGLQDLTPGMTHEKVY